jgi:hypothetical protein
VTSHSTAQARLDQTALLHELATDALDGDWETFKSLVAATIVMGRSVLHLVQTQDRSHSGFKPWFAQLETRFPTLRFFRDERDALLKERMVALHGLGYRDAAMRIVIKAEGEELPPPPPPTPPPAMTRQAFFDAAGWDKRPALDYLAQYLAELEAVISAAEARF